MKKVFASLLLMMIFMTGVSAEEVSSDVPSSDNGTPGTSDLTTETGTTESEEENVLLNQEVSEVVEYNLILNQPIATYVVNPDDIVSELSTFALRGDVYAGSYNSTITTMWQGLVMNNLGKEYVGWRGSQYDYYIVFGEDYSAESGTFSGSGRVYHTNTYSNTYGYSIYDDSFSINVGDGYVFTNVSQDYPALTNERGALYEEISIMCLFVLVGLSLLKWVFIKR